MEPRIGGTKNIRVVYRITVINEKCQASLLGPWPNMIALQRLCRLALAGPGIAQDIRSVAKPLLVAAESLACDTAGCRRFRVPARVMSCDFPTIVDGDPQKPPGRARAVWRQEEQV